MKVYQCDCCKTVIKDPYEVNFREYFLEEECVGRHVFSKKFQKTATVDLCNYCYSNLPRALSLKDINIILDSLSRRLKENYTVRNEDSERMRITGECILIDVHEFDELIQYCKDLK